MGEGGEHGHTCFPFCDVQLKTYRGPIAGAVERKNATVSGRFYLKDKSSLAHCLFCTYGTHRLRIEVSHA